MKWVFRVAYATVFGETLWLELRAGGAVEVLPMKWKDEGHWELEFEGEDFEKIEYNYRLRVEGGAEVREWGEPRVWERRAEEDGAVCFLDDWRSAGSDDWVYEAKVFDALGDAERPLGKVSWSANHEFNLHMTRLPEGLVPCVCGGIDALGDWDYVKAVPMVEVERNRWQVGLNLPVDWRVEYKYGLYDTAEGRAVMLEDGSENRAVEAGRGVDFVRVCDESFRRSVDLRFRAAGVAIPVFSLRSEEGCGVGEFADLKAMADWAAATGLKLIQILPINDTTSTRTWTDSYPYSAISVYALHPIYLRLDELSYPLADVWRFAEEKQALNEAKQLDYEAVMRVKWRVTREVFEKNHDAILRDTGFRDFLKRNRDWVLDYAIFSVKRDEFGTADFSQWGEWAEYELEKAERLSISTEVMYYVWLQYELDRQLSDAVAHLRSVGVALKGDLPIGVDRESVDAWVAPHLFKMDTQAGAPPDAFAVKGQNWGFPTYDWEAMKQDGYAWWRSRFGKLSRYFDAYRIDHILGFFRIWQVPVDEVEGIMGWFDPAMPVALEECAERGVEFDFDRFCKPFITDGMLGEAFGDLADGVRQDFLDDLGEGRYALKPRFSTQKGILEFFSELKEGDWANHGWLREALLDLVSEVLFFEVEGSEGKEFHPRMSMPDTRSFLALEEDVRWRLKELHDDYFYSRQESFWKAKALEKLPAMRGASDMLLCGEDLGMVPDCVPGVMASLGMLSLEIQRWPKTGSVDFSHPDNAPYQSVVSTGTHDMSTLRGWWREDEQVRAKFAWEMFGDGFSEKELSGGMARRIIAQHLSSPAMWAVFPLQDLLAMDEELRSKDVEGERINVPSIPQFYWRWRMEMTVDELAGEEGFRKKLREMVGEAGR